MFYVAVSRADNGANWKVKRNDRTESDSWVGENLDALRGGTTILSVCAERWFVPNSRVLKKLWRVSSKPFVPLLPSRVLRHPVNTFVGRESSEIVRRSLVNLR